MAPKLFLTGATGYIGGDALYKISKQHPEMEIALLVRSQDKAEKVSSQYPRARIVLGGLDDAETLRKEAAWADIVLHTADSSDHEGAAKAIAQGLIEGHSEKQPGYWIHIGGTGILTYFDSEVKKQFGEPDDKVFDDDVGVDELTNLPAAAFHRHIDEIVLATGKGHAKTVKTAIVCPPTIYGTGRGPVSGRGRQVYEMASLMLNEHYCPRIGRGLAMWNHVHVFDLSDAIVLLVQAALDAERADDAEIWGPKGYFLTESGEHAWGPLAERMAKEVEKQGFGGQGMPVRELTFDEAVKSPAGFEAASWGMNSRATAIRAKKTLGWHPQQPSLFDEIPSIVASEANRLGLKN